MLAGTGKLEGRSEQLLGQFLDAYPGSPAVRGNVRIATKLAAYPWRLTPKQVGAGRVWCRYLIFLRLRRYFCTPAC